jgi:hypothetical protein
MERLIIYKATWPLEEFRYKAYGDTFFVPSYLLHMDIRSYENNFKMYRKF